MTPNLLVLIGTAFIPFVIAIIWFHKSLFGGSNWTTIADIPTAKADIPVKPFKIFLSLLLNFLLAFGVFVLSVHEFSVLSLVGGNAELLVTGTGAAFLAEHGGNWKTVTHGLAHGIQAIFAFALPMVGYVTIFEQKSAKYFWVYMGYWAICLILMSIVLSMFGGVSIV